MSTVYLRKKFWPGPYPPSIMLDRNIIQLEADFIKANNLTPQQIPTQELNKRRMLFKTNAGERDLEVWLWRFGGMKELHFHHGGDIYVLSQNQWNKFSRNLLSVFSKKLEGAKTISFDQAAELAEIVDSIG
jgi:hypothetical protein